VGGDRAGALCVGQRAGAGGIPQTARAVSIITGGIGM
jgi:hypothetical protein